MNRRSGPLSRAGRCASSPVTMACRWRARASLRFCLSRSRADFRSVTTSGCLRAASWSRRLGVGRFLAPGRSSCVSTTGSSSTFFLPHGTLSCTRQGYAVKGPPRATRPAARVDGRGRRRPCPRPDRRDQKAGDGTDEDSANAAAELLRAEGLQVEIVREGGRPAVIGHRDGPPGSPTVTLYAHHDVQPPGDPAQWDSPAFEPTERNGRLYARGAADDKAGVMAHVAALRAFPEGPPVGVTVFLEGEEEIGSDSLLTILERHSEKLRADAIVLADGGNWDLGEPALTVTLRGTIRVVVTVRTLDHGVHSGMFGGAVPDAITTLIRLIATLHDSEGDVAVEGLRSAEASDLDYSE